MSNVFISHGAPNLIFQECKSKENLKKIKEFKGDSRYIIAISAHWTTRDLKIISPDAKELIYDFYGFEDELYRFKYNIKSDFEQTQKLYSHLKKSFDIEIDSNRIGYDHGIWSPLSIIFESLDIAVIQLSLPLSYSIDELLKLGQELKPFLDEAMLITSGSLTHNLYKLNRNLKSKPDDKVTDFCSMVRDIFKSADIDKLKVITKRFDFAEFHPTNEHFLPIYINAGANQKATSINDEILYSCLSMESFLFRD